MSPAKLDARMVFLMRELLREAVSARNPLTERRLRHLARRLMYWRPGATSPNPEVRGDAARLADEAEDILVEVITARDLSALEEGNTR